MVILFELKTEFSEVEIQIQLPTYICNISHYILRVVYLKKKFSDILRQFLRLKWSDRGRVGVKITNNYGMLFIDLP